MLSTFGITDKDKNRLMYHSALPKSYLVAMYSSLKRLSTANTNLQLNLSQWRLLNDYDHEAIHYLHPNHYMELMKSLPDSVWLDSNRYQSFDRYRSWMALIFSPTIENYTLQLTVHLEYKKHMERCPRELLDLPQLFIPFFFKVDEWRNLYQ